MNSEIKKIYIIFNPNAGKHHPVFRWLNQLFGWSKVKKRQSPLDALRPKLQQQLESAGIECAYEKTKGAGDATKIAKHVVNQALADTVIAMGGDGTINEVVNGLIGSTVKLGVIPYGTANVFGVSFGLPSNVTEAANRILTGTIKKIDVGSVNNHYFVCMAGIGFDAYIIKKAEKSLKKIWCIKLRYRRFMGILKVSFSSHFISS